MNEVLQKLSAIGIVPVVVINDVEKAVPLAKALVKGGIPCAEVTFRTAAAEESIRRMAKEVPELIVGAGTVLTKEQADKAIAAGSKFLVSPGLDPELVAYCNEKGYLITPGTCNPSDLNHAVKLGLEVVKFFPAEAAGGLNMIKSMAAAYTGLKFMPTGGINANNLNDYLSYEKIICCGGSWMVKGSLIDAGEFDKIVYLCKEAVAAMLGFEVAFNRTSLTLHEGDIVYVAQYVGPRLPEGTTTLPENSEIKFYEIRLPQDPCKKCHNRDCGLCRLKAAGFAGNNKSLWF